MLEANQQSRSPAQFDPATHVECLGFIRAAIAEGCPQTARDIKNVLTETYQRGYLDRAKIWADLTPAEQKQYRQLLASPPIVNDFLDCGF